MKKAIYMICGVILNIVAVFAFHKHLVLSEASASVVFMIALLCFWSNHFSHLIDNDMPINTGGMDLNAEEQDSLGKVIGLISYGVIPLLIPFIFFFNDKIKVGVPSVLALSVIIVGIIFFRLRYGKKVRARIEAEEKEKIEQEKREH